MIFHLRVKILLIISNSCAAAIVHETVYYKLDMVVKLLIMRNKLRFKN